MGELIKLLGNNKNKVQTFNEKSIRTVWDVKNEKWWICIIDVIAALTNTKDPKDYLKKLRKRDTELKEIWEQLITPLPFRTAGGVQTPNFSDFEGISRITQLISRQKTEPFKQWLEQLSIDDE